MRKAAFVGLAGWKPAKVIGFGLAGSNLATVTGFGLRLAAVTDSGRMLGIIWLQLQVLALPARIWRQLQGLASDLLL